MRRRLVKESDYLFEVMRKSPYEAALYSAYADCLTEEGDEQRALLVKRLIEAEEAAQRGELYLLKKPERIVDLCRFGLGLSRIEVNSLLAYDQQCGTVYPVRSYGNDVIGVAIKQPKDGQVAVLRPMYDGNQHTDLPLMSMLPQEIKKAGWYASIETKAVEPPTVAVGPTAT
jgi:uncharacterized protein (TIGR02996 family)